MACLRHALLLAVPLYDTVAAASTNLPMVRNHGRYNVAPAHLTSAYLLDGERGHQGFNASDHNNFRIFLSWLQGFCKAQFFGDGTQALELADFHGSRGLRVMKAAAAGELLAYVPRQCMISAANATSTRLKAVEPEQVRLIFYIAEQRQLGDRSPWANYLSMLPSLEEYQTYHLLAALGMNRKKPGFQLPKELMGFTGLPAVERVQKVLEALRHAHTVYKKIAHAEPREAVSWREVIWGACTATRLLSFPGPHPVHYGYVPFIDFMNTVDTYTDWKPTTSYQINHNGDFVLRATSDLHAGDELTIRFLPSAASDESHEEIFGITSGVAPSKLTFSAKSSHCPQWMRAADSIKKAAGGQLEIHGGLTDNGHLPYPPSPLANNLAILAKEECQWLGPIYMHPHLQRSAPLATISIALLALAVWILVCPMHQVMTRCPWLSCYVADGGNAEDAKGSTVSEADARALLAQAAGYAQAKQTGALRE